MKFGINFRKKSDDGLYQMVRDGEPIVVPTETSAMMEAEYHYKAIQIARQYIVVDLLSGRDYLFGTPGDAWYTRDAKVRAWTNR